MLIPENISPGDCIGIVSPGKKIEAERITNAVRIIHDLGYKVIVGENALAGDRYLAGTDAERSADFQAMLDNSEIRLILCSRGGYGSARIIDRLDFTSFIKNPKWIAGFSDITVFHSHLINMGCESLHGIMPLDFEEHGKLTKPVQALFDFAAGKVSDYEFPSHEFSRQGRGQGVLVGGNLSLLAGLIGSRSAPGTQGKILFIEEVGEKWYRFDRMMLTLKRAGMLDGLAGLIVGGLTRMEAGVPEFDFSVEEIVLQHVGDDYPVAFGFPAGHFPENYPLIMGRSVEVTVGAKTYLKFENNNYE